MERLFSGMRISSAGLTAERTRIDVIAENIANARTTRTASGGPYRRKVVSFEPLLQQALEDGSVRLGGIGNPKVGVDRTTPFQKVLEPGHPDADANGNVQYPNVNTVMEMADLVTAMRAYEANISVQENFVRMAERALALASR
jgi:flagellar basal-body rod protein FlgC